MKTPSFKSFASMLLAGALSAPLMGCGLEGATDDDAVASETGALTRLTAVADVEAATVESTTTTRRIPTVADRHRDGRTPARTIDLARNHPWTVFISGTGGLNCRGTLDSPAVGGDRRALHRHHRGQGDFSMVNGESASRST